MVSQPQVGEYSPTKLSDLFVGTRESQHFSGDMESEYAIFTDRTSADNYAKKQRLLHTGIGFLKRLSVEQLEEIVPAIDPHKAENTIAGIKADQVIDQLEWPNSSGVAACE